MAFLRSLHREIKFIIIFFTETSICKTETQMLFLPNVRKVVLLKCPSVDLRAVYGEDLAVTSGALGFQTLLLDNSQHVSF